jgi:glycosyltransferase involved in cell wall biosynthesis
MKLLFYSHYFLPSVGGVETIVFSLAEGIAKRSAGSAGQAVDVTVATQTPAGAFDDAALPFRVVRRPGAARLWKLIRETDVLHVAGPALLPLALAALQRIPVIVEHHGFQTICPNGQLLIEPAGAPCPGHFMNRRYAECLRCNAGQGSLASLKLWLLTFVRRFFCARVSSNVTPTEWLGGLLRLPRVVPIPHGLEAAASLSPPQAAPSAGPPVIVFQGRLVTTKGVRLLLEAARILAQRSVPFEIRIIGGGSERTSLERLAHEWNLAERVLFLGSLSASKLEAELAQASAVIVPSLGGEVFGLVVAENMLRGLPVVASDLGAFAEVLGDAGLTFRAGDSGDLARALAQLLSDSVLAAGLGRRGRHRVQEFFARGRMIEAHLRVYASVIRAETR